jgi:hypothetical protein
LGRSRDRAGHAAFGELEDIVGVRKPWLRGER